MLNQQLIDWPSVVSRLNNVNVVAGVSPLQQLNNLLDQLGRQVVMSARGDSANKQRNDALYFGLSCIVVGSSVLSKQLLGDNAR